MGPAQPIRTCVGCRDRGGKRTLVRIARRPDGAVAVDPTATMPGRGAYVHADPACIDAAFARGGIGRALRTSVADGAAARLRDDLKRLEGAV